MLTKDCTEMHLLPFYICIFVWLFCFIFSVYVSTDAYCGPRTTSEASIYLPPCFEAVSFCCSSAVYFRLVSPQDPWNSPVSNSHPLLWALDYRHSLLCPAFTCVLVFGLRSSCLCTRHLTLWAICPALLLYKDVFTFSCDGQLKCSL